MYIEQDFFLEMYLVKGKKLRNSPFLVKSIANYKKGKYFSFFLIAINGFYFLPGKYTYESSIH